MEFDIRAVALDLDGTLLNPEHKISPYTVEIIETLAARGIICIVATGRSVGLVRLIENLPRNFYAVCLNGSQLVHLSDPEPLEEHFVPVDLAEAVIEVFGERRYHLHAYCGEKLIYEDADWSMLEKYSPQIRELPIFERVDFASIRRDRIYKFITLGSDEQLAPFVSRLRERFGDSLYAGYSMPGIMELMSSSVSKGSGLTKLLGELGLSGKNLMAIGDGWNDLPMWEIAAVPVVMGNAFPELKRKNYYQAPSHEDDGAAQFLRTWFRLC